MKKLEEEKKEEPSPGHFNPSLPTPPPFVGLPLQPKGLNFSTPQSRSREKGSGTPSTPGTVQSDKMSDVESLSSENTCVTPEMSKLNLGKHRGRPRKELVQPNMDDFPFDSSPSVQKAYIRKKNTEMWRYKKLTGADSAAYRQEECERVTKYQKKKKEMKENDGSNESEDSDRKRELSRQR